MATWCVGNMRTLNTYAFGQGLTKNNLTEAAFYDGIIRRYLKVSRQDLARLRKAWRLFGQAMDNYPFSIPFLYESVVNYSPAYWLPPGRIKGTPLGRAWMLDKRGDDLSPAIKGCTLGEIIKGFEFTCRKWDKGTEIYRTLFQKREEKRTKEESGAVIVSV